MKKAVIVYASWTGHTQKIAMRFKQVFDKYEWECDVFKIEYKTDLNNLPFNFDNYDLICIGSPVIGKRPTDEIAYILGGPAAVKGSPSSPENLAYARGERGPRKDDGQHYEKIIFGPDTKKGIVFVTAGECHIPLEYGVEPALSFMECDLYHLKIEPIGRFYCPGKLGKANSPYIKDLSTRPNERDIMKAEIFLEETLERYY